MTNQNETPTRRQYRQISPIKASRNRQRKRPRITVFAVLISLAATFWSSPQTSAATVPGQMTLIAQNFHIFTSGNLRFVVTVDSQDLIAQLTNESAVFRISLGERITKGQQQVQDVFEKPESIVVTDSVDLTIREVTRRANGEFELVALSTDVASGTRRIEFNGYGIYPVRVDVLVNGVAQASLTSFVNRYNASKELKPMPVNTLIALDTPITLQPDGSRMIDPTTRTKIEKVIKLLQLDASKISIQISPELLEGLSSSTNSLDQTLLVQLVAALEPASLIGTTYIPFDPSIASANKQNAVFDSLRTRGTSTLTNISPSSKLNTNVWVTRSPLDQNGLDLLVKNGVRSVFMLSTASAVLGEYDNAARPYRLASNKTDVSLHLADRSYVEQLSTPNNNSFLAATFLSAQILAQRNQIETEGGVPALRRIVLTSQDGSVINENLIHETLLILSRVPQQVALRALGNLPAPRLDAYRPTLKQIDPKNFAETTVSIATLRSDFEKLRTTISANAKIWKEWDERLLVISSESMSKVRREEFVVAMRDELKKIRQSVTLQDGTTFTLGSRESELRLDLQNSSDFAMTVQVKVVSSKLRFTNDAPVVEVPANGSRELVVNVVALSNGLFPVEVRIFTADGRSQLGKKIQVSARVNALAGLGQIVTGVGLLLLATWWGAHIRRKHRKKISKNHPVLRSKP